MGGFEVRLLESVLTEKYRELKHPIKRINMTSERMRQMLPAHEEQFLVKAREGDVRASRDFRRKLQQVRARPCYCLLEDPDWQRLRENGSQSPPAKEIIFEVFETITGEKAWEKWLFQQNLETSSMIMYLLGGTEVAICPILASKPLLTFIFLPAASRTFVDSDRRDCTTALKVF